MMGGMTVSEGAVPASGPRRRVMILGIDGGTLTVIRPLVEAGLLPTLARLMEGGSWGNLKSTIPPITPPAWTSLSTGTYPGKHGIYDFVSRRPRTYETWLATAARRDGAPLWELLSRAGRKVTVFNVPVTHPAKPVNGLFVGGMLTPPHAPDGTWPRDLLNDIRQQVPGFDFLVPSLLVPGEELQFLETISAENETTLRVARYLLAREPWDFCMVVFMAADHVSHFLWHEMEEGQKAAPQDPSSLQARLSTAIHDCYRQIDSALGELIASAGSDTYVIVVSDHGFGSLESNFHVNTWLLDRGYVKLKRTLGTRAKRALFELGITRLALGELVRRSGVARRARTARRYEMLEEVGIATPAQESRRRRTQFIGKLIKRLFLSFDDVDWTRTKLFALGAGGPLYVNLKGRDPHGFVTPGAEYEALLDQVTTDLLALREPGTDLPLFGEVLRREGLYWGRHADEAPDLTPMPRDMKISTPGMIGFSSRKWLTPTPTRTGQHRMEGILFVKGPGIRQGLHLDDSPIVDVAPTVLALMGEPIPTTMDGHVLEKVMTEELRTSLKASYFEPAEEEAPESAGAEIDAEEEEKMRQHLRGLGYVA
jgi:predicted AlkP superfamily phosphohydrolase/phosphomutase